MLPGGTSAQAFESPFLRTTACKAAVALSSGTRPCATQALAGAIGRMLDDPTLRERIGAAGMKRALEKFTWKATAIGTAEQYRIIIDETEAKKARAS